MPELLPELLPSTGVTSGVTSGVAILHAVWPGDGAVSLHLRQQQHQFWMQQQYNELRQTPLPANILNIFSDVYHETEHESEPDGDSFDPRGLAHMMEEVD